MYGLRTMDGDDHSTQQEYDPARVKKDLRNTVIYCVLSLILLLAAFYISDPAVMEILPGGAMTSMAIGIIIIISVFVLCYWQRPKRR